MNGSRRRPADPGDRGRAAAEKFRAMVAFGGNGPPLLPSKIPPRFSSWLHAVGMSRKHTLIQPRLTDDQSISPALRPQADLPRTWSLRCTKGIAAERRRRRGRRQCARSGRSAMAWRTSKFDPRTCMGRLLSRVLGAAGGHADRRARCARPDGPMQALGGLDCGLAPMVEAGHDDPAAQRPVSGRTPTPSRSGAITSARSGGSCSN